MTGTSPTRLGRPIDEVREIRDMIDERVSELVHEKIHAIRLDATAHRFRLEKLLPQLIEEFGDSRPAEVIRGCADRVLDDYDDVPIRSHILTLAHKRTRECLRQAHCDVLEASDLADAEHLSFRSATTCARIRVRCSLIGEPS